MASSNRLSQGSRQACGRRGRAVFGAAALVAVALTGAAQAQSGSWSAGGGANTNWSNTANWTGGVIADGADNTATFNTDLVADATVTLDTARTIGNLVFGDPDTATAGGWTVAGAPNTLTLATTTGTPTITVNALGAGKAATLNVPIAGTAGFEKLGAGTLALRQTSTYTGATKLSGGTLDVSNTAQLGSSNGGGMFVFNGGTLLLSSAGDRRVGGTGASGNPGGFNIVTGTTNTLISQGATGTSTNGLIIGNDANTWFQGGGTLTIETVEGAARPYATFGQNVPANLAANPFTGKLIISRTILTLGGGNNTSGQAAYELTNGATLGVRNSTSASLGSLTGSADTVLTAEPFGTSQRNVTYTIGGANTSTEFAGVIKDGTNSTPGRVSITKAGTGTLTLSGANTYSGATVINAGAIVITKPDNLANSATTINVADGLRFASGIGATVTISSLAGAGNLTLADASANPINLRVGRSTGIFSGNLVGGGSVTKFGNGVQTLSGTNTYTGTTTVETGTLVFGSAASVGGTGQSVTVNAGAAVGSLAGFQDPAFLARINPSTNAALALTSGDTNASFDFTTGALVPFANWSIGVGENAQYNGTITPAGNTYRFGGGGGTLTINSVLSGDRNLVVSPTGTFVLANANTFTGTTTINANAILHLGNGGGNGAVAGDIVNNGTLVIRRGDVEITNKITGTGTVSVPNDLGGALPPTVLFTGIGSSFGTLSINSTVLTAQDIAVNRLDGAGTAVGGVNSSYLEVAAGKFTLKANPASVQSTANILVLDAGASLDIGNNELRITDTTAASTDKYVAALDAAYNHGKWDGVGIGSSAVAATGYQATIGYGVVGTGANARFVLKYTLPGDANLDGAVNSADVALMTTGASWQTGDFNYDNQLTADDYALLAAGAALGSAPNPAVVPEPSAALLLASGLVAPALRRRRSR